MHHKRTYRMNDDDSKRSWAIPCHKRARCVHDTAV